MTETPQPPPEDDPNVDPNAGQPAEDGTETPETPSETPAEDAPAADEDAPTPSGHLHITPVEGAGDLVKVKADRPGERAVSATVDARELIHTIADTIGVTVTIDGEE